MTDADLDTVALAILKEVHNQGAVLYNAGDPVGAFRIYEGCLKTCRAFLVHRPAVQQRITDGMAEVARTGGGRVLAYRLHELIDEVRADLKATRRPAGVQPPPPSTVWTKEDIPDGLLTTRFDPPTEFPGVPKAD
jgi:hypothetical protein